MFGYQCPYCREENHILFGEEIENLIRKGETDCKCDYCRRTVIIYQGKTKYEVKKQKNLEGSG